MRIKSVKPLENYQLQVEFSDGKEKIVDFKNKIKEKMYSDLEDKYLFNSVRVDAGGYGISWNDDIDISEYELYVM
ncbi:MAG: DUF2442 domain-containing protein [Sarcina sp.]